MRKNKVCFHRHERHMHHTALLICDGGDDGDARKRKYFFTLKIFNHE